MDALALARSLARLPATVAMNRIGLVPRPSFLTFTVTWRCNARCSFCGSWRKEGGDEMSLADMGRVLRSLGRLDCVRITGGEPTLRADLPDIVDLAVRTCRPVSVVVSTNGLLPDRLESLVCSVRRPSVLHVHVSLDAVGARHDELRGVPGASERVLESISRLARLRERLGFGLATAQTVVDGRGPGEYAALRDLSARMGIRHHVVIGHAETAVYSRTGPARVDPGRSGLSPFPGVGREAMLGLLAEARRDASAWPLGPERIARLAYLSGARVRVAGGRPQARRCAALRSHVRVLPDGGVPVCQFNTDLAGNLARDPLERVWRGPTARDLRRWVDACPGCWAECETGPSVIYSGLP